MLLIRNQTKKTASNLTVTAHMCSSDFSKWNWPFSVTSTDSMIQIFCNNNIMKSLPKLSIIWQSYKAVQRMFVEICFWRFKSRLSDTMKVIVNVPTNIQFWRKNNHGQGSKLESRSKSEANDAGVAKCIIWFRLSILTLGSTLFMKFRHVISNFNQYVLEISSLRFHWKFNENKQLWNILIL